MSVLDTDRIFAGLIPNVKILWDRTDVSANLDFRCETEPVSTSTNVKKSPAFANRDAPICGARIGVIADPDSDSHRTNEHAWMLTNVKIMTTCASDIASTSPVRTNVLVHPDTHCHPMRGVVRTLTNVWSVNPVVGDPISTVSIPGVGINVMIYHVHRDT